MTADTDGSQASRADTRARFKDRVRQWREDAILQAVSDLLADEGCLDLTMDDVAGRIGIAKGTLYLHTTTRDELLSQLLERWARDVASPRPDAGPYDWADACASLFERVERGTSKSMPSFPCCLRTSPCPHGWLERWRTIAASFGLPVELEADTTTVVGEAIQALAVMPHIRQVVSEDRLIEARDEVLSFVTGYISAAVASTVKV